MYKRYLICDDSTTSLGGIVTFAVLVCGVVWLVPVVVLAVTEMPMDIFMMPPIWRGDIMCRDGTTIHYTSYVYTDGVCTAQCEPDTQCIPQHGPVSIEQMRINLEKARQGLGLYDIYLVGMLVLQYGSIICVVCSAGVMFVRAKRYVWVWCVIPCGVGAALCGIYGTVWYGVIALGVAYIVDVYSTARFGESLQYREANPILRRLFALYTIRRALTIHTMLYCVLIVGASILFSMGPFPIHHTMGILLFGLAACHVYCATNNIKLYQENCTV